MSPASLADLAVLSADYFSVPEEEIKGIESVLTVVGGKVVYGAGEFAQLAPPPLPVLPEWSPVNAYGGYHSIQSQPIGAVRAHACTGVLRRHHDSGQLNEQPFWGLGCECFAF